MLEGDFCILWIGMIELALVLGNNVGFPRNFKKVTKKKFYFKK